MQRCALYLCRTTLARDLDGAQGNGKVALAFRMGGRQVGPLSTAVGPLAPTGQHLQLRVIDVLTLSDGRISAINMVADELGALAAVGAVRLPLA